MTSVESARRAGSRAAADPRYNVFISYSRAVDAQLAPALQSSLQRFAKPWYRMRALSVFRDDASLSANPGLWSSICAALDASDFFVLLASPEAARSRWVCREVWYWKKHKPADRLLIVLTDGELLWDGSRREFDRRNSAVPATARGVFREEPRYTDLRWARRREQLSLSDPRFRSDVADIAATVHRRPKDELVGEEVRQHRRTVLVARGAAILLAGLVLIAGAAAWTAARQRDDAQAQRDLARDRERDATSRALALQSTASLDDRLDRASLLALEAMKAKPTSEARSALLSAVQTNPRLHRYVATNSRAFSDLAFSSDGKTIAAARADGVIVFFDDRTGRRRGRPLPVSGGLLGGLIAFRGSRELAVLRYDANLVLYDLRTRKRRAVRLESRRLGNPLDEYSFSPDGTRLVGYEPQTGRTTVWAVDSGRRVAEPLQLPHECGAIGLGPNGWWVAVACGNRVTVWHTDDRAIRSRHRMGSSVSTLAFSRGPEYMLAAGTSAGTIDVWQDPFDEIGYHVTPSPLVEQNQYISGLAFGSDGYTLASASLRGDKNSEGTLAENGTILLWDLHSRQGNVDEIDARSLPAGVRIPASGSQFSGATSPTGNAKVVVTPYGRPILVRSDRSRQSLAAGPGRTTAMLFSSDGSILATANEDGSVVLWHVADGRRFPAGSGGGTITSLAFARDGMLLASATPDGMIVLWDVASHRQIGLPMRYYHEPVDGLAFDRTGTRLYSRLLGGSTVVVWDTNPASWKRRACQRANRNLQKVEWERFIGANQAYAETCP